MRCCLFDRYTVNVNGGMKMKKKWIALLLAVCMMTALLPTAAAEENIAKAEFPYTDHPYYFTSVSALNSFLEEHEGQSVTVDMLSDWGNERLCIPEDTTVTLNMHGHIYNRGLTESTRNGEVIWIGSDAKLTINGYTSANERNTEHTVGVYHSWRREGTADQNEIFCGGVIAGGYSTNGGGGIDVKANVTLTLNHVTIAGCRAEQSAGTDGYGGGIWVHGGVNEGGTVIMNYSTITGCYAYNSGGGLYQSNHDKFYMEMNQSHIDRNYCYSDGGGIYLGGATITIKGDNGSYISGNRTGAGGGENGGGVYVYNDGVTLSRLIITNNRAYDGGGVYCDDKKITLSECTLSDNYATHRGGGVYIGYDNTTISSCSISDNGAQYEGSGVYVESGVDEGFNITGNTHIAGNTADNLYFENNVRANFTLTNGANVRLRYKDMPDTYRMVTEGSEGDTIKTTDCIRFLHSDVSGYHFTFNSAPNQRKIYLVKDGYTDSTVGASYTPGSPIVISAEEAAAAAKTPVEGYTITGFHDGSTREYDLFRGYYRYPSIDDPSANNVAVFYYSDGYFDAHPDTYNEHLATMSTAMAMAGMYLQSVDYPYKHAAIRQLMADIGVQEDNIYVNAYNTQKPGTDTVGVAIGSKALKDRTGEETGYILIPIAVRGGGYEAEWASNMTLGRGDERNGEAQGFSEAADIVEQEIENYLDQYDLRGALQEGRIKFWIAGFSRAGATSNLTAKRLVEKYACGTSPGENNTVFAYCIEAPQGGTDKAEQLGSAYYYCIHNVINYADIVPLVGPTEMGFKRYGVDHFVPGTEAGQIGYRRSEADRAGSYSGITTVTRREDNDPILSKNDSGDNAEYIALRDKMLPQLRAMDSDIVFDDYFHLTEMNFISGSTFEEQGDYSVSEEWFIRSFLRVFQSSSLTSRDKWAVENVVINGVTYSTMQQALRETCALVFGMDEENMQQLVNKASRIAGTIRYIPVYSYEYGMIEIWKEVIGNWGELSEAKKQSYLNFFWDRLKASGALEYIDAENVSRLYRNFPTLADRILYFIDWDYAHTHTSCPSTSNMIWTGTFAANAGKILMNHYPEVDIAWQRAADSFYNGEVFDERNKEYTLALPSHIDAPSAFYTVTDDQGQQQRERITTSAVVELEGAQRLILDVPDLDGEMIWYTQNGSDWKLYTGGIDLTIEEGQASSSYYIRTYARWYDCSSQITAYQIKLLSGKHSVTVETKIDGESGVEEQTVTGLYAAGETVSLHADIPSSKFFIRWNIQNQSGAYVTNKLIPDSEQQKQPDASFVMPEPGSTNFPADYELTCRASYGELVGEVDISMLDAENDPASPPTAGEPLPYQFLLQWNGTDHHYYGADWYLHTEDGSKILWDRSIPAFNHTVYSAVLTVHEDWQTRFTDDVSAVFLGAEGSECTCRTDPVTHDLIVEITFPATGYEGEEYEPDLQNADLFTLTVTQWNKNRVEPTKAGEDKVIQLLKGHTIELDPPEIDDMAFCDWEYDHYALDDMGIHIISRNNLTGRLTIQIEEDATDALTLPVWYLPVISRVEITLAAEDWAPVAAALSEPLPEVERVVITAGGEYEVYTVDNGNAFFRASISPNGRRITDENGNRVTVYDYDTEYTATILYTNGINETRVTDCETSEDFYAEGYYRFAEDAVILINGRSADMDSSGKQATVVFPRTVPGAVNLIDFVRPTDIVVPNGSSRDTIRHEYLPEKTAITVDDGSVTQATVVWTDIEPDPDPGTLDEVVCTATGHLSLPFGVYQNGIDTTFAVQITVKEADPVAAPVASAESGAYPAEFDVTLSSGTQGAQIYYTLDGSDPVYSTTPYTAGTAIRIAPDMTDGNGEVILRAYAVRSNCKDSPEAVYVYTFTNKIEPPVGETLSYCAQLQIGVETSPFWTLIAEDGSGVTIDENGNACATNAGTYTVRAHIADGYVWKIGETEPQAVAGEPDEDGNVPITWIREDITSEEDQEVTFVIEKASIGNAVVSAEDQAYTGQPITPDVTLRFGDTVIPADEYSVSFENNTEIGTATILVTANEINYTGTATGSFQIISTVPTFASHSLVLSGQIGVNFFMDLSMLTEAEKETSYMTFGISGAGEVSSDPVPFDPTQTNASGALYGFTCYVTSIQMADTITATFHYGDGQTISETYSIRQYIDSFDAYIEEHPGAYDEETVNLVHALADYGHYVQPFLSAARGWTLGSGDDQYAEMDLCYTTEYNINAVKTAVADYGIQRTMSADIAGISYSLLMDSDTAIYLYFKPIADYDGGFTVDGYTATKQKDGRYLVKIPNIGAHKLGDPYTVVATTTKGESTVTVSALSYVKGVLDAEAYQDNTAAQYAAASIYHYYAAAAAYKRIHP